MALAANTPHQKRAYFPTSFQLHKHAGKTFVIRFSLEGIIDVVGQHVRKTRANSKKGEVQCRRFDSKAKAEWARDQAVLAQTIHDEKMEASMPSEIFFTKDNISRPGVLKEDVRERLKNEHLNAARELEEIMSNPAPYGAYVAKPTAMSRLMEDDIINSLLQEEVRHTFWLAKMNLRYHPEVNQAAIITTGIFDMCLPLKETIQRAIGKN